MKILNQNYNINVYSKQRLIYVIQFNYFTMARPANPNRVTTPISILKSQKLRLRKYAQPDQKRKGYESDQVVLERILREYETNHAINCEPKSTYATKG
jgi:hypothetical protein